jgi:PTS system nitrogen regulatory IIA component
MSITDLLQSADVHLDVDLGSKKEVLQFLSERVSERCGSRVDECRHALAAREKLGSTAIGSGIAFPHAQLEGLDKAMAVFLRPATPVEFGAADGTPVDLVLLLLTPAGASKAHLEGIASFARALRKADTIKQLRSAHSAEEVMAAFGS